MSSLLRLNIFQTFFYCFRDWLWTGNSLSGMQSKLNGVILHFPCAGFRFLIAVTLFINDNNIINIIYLKKALNYNHHWSLCLPRKLEIQVPLSAIFFMKTLRFDCCFVLLLKFIFVTMRWVSFSICGYEMSIVQHFSVSQSILNLEIKRRLNFND